MQVVEFKRPQPNRPLKECPVCHHLGYYYKRIRGNHYYRFTIHYNEDPVRYYKGKPVYKRCYDNGRLYDSIEEAIQAENIRRQKEPKFKKTSKIINCPKCGKKGRLNQYHPDKTNHPDMINDLVIHEAINGTWGKRGTMKKRRRCYLSPKTFFES
jgi:hypothetical protein